jgi:chemotaxis protein methyltransferase CheR
MNTVLKPESFARVRQMLMQHTGIELNDSKVQMASNRLTKPMRVLGLTDLADYLALVQNDSKLLQGFINAMTTNVTSFFRESHHFQILIHELRGKQHDARLWSAGCSTGQEPYSILFTVLEAFPELISRLKRPIVLATDIDTQALAHAKAGVYLKTELNGAFQATALRAYFDEISATELQVKPALKRLIEFKPYNLATGTEKVPWQHLDAIFCRNVMIYFGTATQRRITERFHAALKAEGTLFTGHSEMLIHSDGIFRSLGRTVFKARSKDPSRT